MYYLHAVRLPVLQSRSAVYDALPPAPEGFAAQGLPRLRDGQGRAYDYLRLSVTDRCDLACIYCMPPKGEDDHAVRREMLTFEESARLVTIAAAMGIRRVRFTGGEPLIRKDIVRLVDLVSRRTEIEQLAMTTNATRLAELARPLRAAGLGAVNISLDSLDPERFSRLTRGGDLGRVLAGIQAALDVGMEVKLNTVLLRGETDDEAERLVDYAWDNGITLRFIELMPLGEGALLPRDLRVPCDEVAARLGSRLKAGMHDGGAARGPARYLHAADGSGRRVGFITPMSNEFCDTCNRIRVTSRGDIRACLASRRAVSLRAILRAGGSDADVAWALTYGLGGKPEGHFFSDPDVGEHLRVGMSLIGG